MSEDLGRSCLTCGAFKPLEAFSPQRRGLYGRRSKCKTCATAATKVYNEKHREEVRASGRANKARKRADPVEKTKLIEANKRWNAAHPEDRPRRNKAYYQANKEQFKKNVRAYLDANPDKAKAWSQNYRARRRSGGLLTGEMVRGILDPATECFYCEQPFGPLRQKTLDHIIPLCQGGPNESWNLVPCCKSCNSTKKHRTPVQWGPPIGNTRLLEKLRVRLLQD